MGKDDQRQRDCLPLDFLAGLGWAGLGCVRKGAPPNPGRGLGTDLLSSSTSPVSLSPSLVLLSPLEEKLFLIVNCAIANWLLSWAE